VSLTLIGSGSPAPTYQWRKGGNNLAGETSATLSIASATAADQGSYDCVLTNSCDSTTSTAVTITVNTPPTILTQPVAQSACVNGTAMFSISASASPAPTYQWRFNGNDLPGETGTTLTVTPVTPGSQGSYDCVVTNSCTSVPSDAAPLTVDTAPVISTDPVPVTTSEGGSAQFSVTASGANLTYQWRLNNAPLSEGAPYSGTNTSTLTISPATSSIAGDYSCLVSNNCGSVPSNGAALTVEQTGCGTSDFDGDGDFGTDADIEAFFACLGGNCCATCYVGGADFNADGDIGTDADIESFFRVLGGGNC
jgi:hypothetical protein